jgi:hypothetical protein
MKTTLLFLSVFISVSLLGQDCDKFFKKNKKKKNKSSVFNNTKVVNSHWIKFYKEGAREIFLQFTNRTGGNVLGIQQKTKRSIIYKQPLVLGTQLEIAFIFEDSTHYIVQFENNQEDLGLVLDKYYMSRNFLTISNELSDKLSALNIISFEIKNPFSSSNINSDKVLIQENQGPDGIKIIYNCFLDKTNNN